MTVKGDLIAELDETFRVILSSPSNAGLANPQGLGTITDDELLPVIDIDEPSIVEGQSGTSSINFSVILSHPSATARLGGLDDRAGNGRGRHRLRR